ncbi:MAG: helix-turn-helix transcriptional regulator [Xanthomonadaceae bacterium]|nr:helix-turn-helix transcriptional regulator [Xanthomonadaceae bacterium]
MGREQLANHLKVRRAERNLTQADLAALSNTTRKSINAIEMGRMVPSTFLALKLAHALDSSVEQLFYLARR